MRYKYGEGDSAYKGGGTKIEFHSVANGGKEMVAA